MERGTTGLGKGRMGTKEEDKEEEEEKEEGREGRMNRRLRRQKQSNPVRGEGPGRAEIFVV